MIDYLKKLNEPELYQDLVEYAINNKVPIIKEEGLWLLKKIIRLVNAKNILEIGSAIGYSALHMASIDGDIQIDTIERDSKMIEQAIENFNKYDLNHQINLIKGDALELDLDTLRSQYDLIFIDAAKAQYQKFFLKYTTLLKKGGIVVTDNIIYHQLVNGHHNNISKNTQSLVKKIDAYNHWLQSLDDYSTTFLSIGDGLAISERIK